MDVFWVGDGFVDGDVFEIGDCDDVIGVGGFGGVVFESVGFE